MRSQSLAFSCATLVRRTLHPNSRRGSLPLTNPGYSSPYPLGQCARGRTPLQHVALLRDAVCMSAGQTPAEEVTTRVLDYWVGKPRSRYAGASPDRKKLWFSSSKEADEFIIQSFGEDVENALNGDRGDLSKVGIRGELALVILLDQFTRNCFRSTAKAFAGDEDALDIARKYYDGVSNRQAAKQKLSLYERFFLYMPLMHSEDLSISKKSVQAVQMLADECQAAVEKGDEDAAEGHAAMLQSLSFAQTHVDILQKFGRFPHRNEALNRESTDDEIAYLKDGPRFGQ